MNDKLRKAFYRGFCLPFVFSTTWGGQPAAQDTAYKRPTVTDKVRDYRNQVRKDPWKKMTDLKERIPGLVYELRYAGTNNFMHRRMYPASTRYTFLRAEAAEALKKVQDELNGKGYGLKIFDAYRPYSVTVAFWELVKDEDYVAHPARGSGHNRGVAVDCSLIRLPDGKEMNLGTDFDNFSDTAHQGFTELPEEIINNRQLLRATMEKYGFKAYEKEWWHYSWPEAARFELLDIGFEKLKKAL